MGRKFDRSLIPPNPTLEFERNLWAQGLVIVGGIDEAGRGALAGPVSAAVVVLPNQTDLEGALLGVRDSKQISHKKRLHWANEIRTIALAHATGMASASEIDQYGIIPATRLAIRRALLAIEPLPEHLLVDALRLPTVPIPQTSLIKGDARALSIAAASILAKTARDAHMLTLDATYPGYKFAENKGYGTAFHLAALKEYGPTSIHRRSFAPLRPTLFDTHDTKRTPNNSSV
jgi:ribonuclease HII